jgi:uncharacterized protein (DUF486 family)
MSQGPAAMMTRIPVALQFVVLLTISNTFMTIAWYGHLKNKNQPLIWAILISWLIALVEYMFQVPANRIGSGRFSLTQLKIAQECLALGVFLIYAFVVFREVPRWNTLAAMALIVAAAYLAFLGRG